MRQTAYIIGLFVVCYVNYSSALSIDEMPRDVFQAELLLEDGSLDRNDWTQIEGFYSSPLSVPQGQLKYLIGVVEGVPDDVPVSQSVLSKYEPWSTDCITAFFDDYPTLSPLRAILDFESAPVRKWARVQFKMDKLSWNDGARGYTDFVLGTRGAATIEGTARFNDSLILWEKRSAVVRYKKDLTLSIGNYSQPIDNGLALNYFLSMHSPENSSHTEIIDNWLYGKGSRWNGGLLEGAVAKKKGRWNIFYHRRLTESIAGSSLKIKVRDKLGLHAAYSFITDNKDSNSFNSNEEDKIEEAHVVYFGTRVQSVNLDCELNAAIDSRGHAAGMMVLEHSHSGGGLKAELAVIPAGFYHEHSRIRQRMYSRMGRENRYNLSRSGQFENEDLALADIEIEKQMHKRFSPYYKVKTVFSRQKAGLEQILGLRGVLVDKSEKSKCRYRISYSLFPTTKDGLSAHKLRLSLIQMRLGALKITYHGRLHVYPVEDHRPSGKILRALSASNILFADYEHNAHFSLHPILRYMQVLRQHRDGYQTTLQFTTLGLKQILTLYKNTNNTFVLEIPVYDRRRTDILDLEENGNLLYGIKMQSTINFYF